MSACKPRFGNDPDGHGPDDGPVPGNVERPEIDLQIIDEEFLRRQEEQRRRREGDPDALIPLTDVDQLIREERKRKRKEWHN